MTAIDMRWLRRGGALLIGLILTGCAIKTPYLNISQWPVTKRAMYYHQPLPHRIVLLPLLDQRPAEERHGKNASAMFLLLWNRRVGDYYTGDQVFGGDVPGQLSRQLAGYFQAANLFTGVTHVLAPSPFLELPNHTMVQQLAATHGADYLLVGELEHFFGSQHQAMSMLVLPLYFVNTWGWQDSKTLPWGQTTIRFTLYDGGHGDILWRQRFQAQQTLPREDDPMSLAALESFATVAGQLATELRQLPYDSLAATDTR